jgi:hypothetical protein
MISTNASAVSGLGTQILGIEAWIGDAAEIRLLSPERGSSTTLVYSGREPTLLGDHWEHRGRHLRFLRVGRFHV